MTAKKTITKPTVKRPAKKPSSNAMSVVQTVKKRGRAPRKDEGRPTKYEERFCQEIVEFFTVAEKFDKIVIEHEEKLDMSDGTKISKDKYKLVPKAPPFFEDFARHIGVHYATLREWTTSHVEFSEAYNTAKHLQKAMLVQNGLAGLYPPASFIFVAKNITDMVDESTQKQKHSGHIDMSGKTDEELDAIINGYKPAKNPSS